MDTVRVEGVTYTKVATIAKKFRYTTDYVGQLCRSGKVDCQFVGRAWYVSEESLLRHKDGRYVESRVAEKMSISKESRAETDEKISVSPRLKKVTAKQVLEAKSHFLTRLDSVGSKYYADETELLPQPLKIATTETAPRERIVPTVPTMIAVEPAESVSVRVIATTKPKKLDFTDVPAVALRGHLAVHEVEIDDDSEVVTASDIAALQAAEAVDEPVTPQPSVDQGISLKPAPKRLVTQKALITQTFTPQTVVVAVAPSRLRLLVTVAVVASGIFAGFFISAFQMFVIDGLEVSASVGFSLDAVRELI